MNGEVVEIADVPASTTLLSWLRYDQGLTGTKEGCAEGDCGACTVAMAEGDIWRPVCACILMLGMVHGRDIRTVEGVAMSDGTPHPVQRALAEGHGSQCGFCTPGFVMSLWCGYANGAPADPSSVAASLAGNLCRCTGYGPILAAAAAARSEPPAEVSPPAPPATAPGLTTDQGGRRFHAPETIEELADLVSTNPEATLVAGATDVGLWLTKRDFDPETVIHLGRVSALREIRHAGDWLEIGATVTYAQAHAVLADLSPSLGTLIDRIGGAQVRAMGTIGGNIANGSPIGDMPPALIALGSELVLHRAGDRRTLALEDFFLDYGRQDLRPGEFVEAVRVPSAPNRLSCYKLSKRTDQDISAVLGCINVTVVDDHVTEARLAYGGMAGIPARARQAEVALTGQPWTRDSIDMAMQAMSRDFSPLSDIRASADYRQRVAQNLLLRYFIEDTAPGAVTRIGAVR